jgi:hypothetical protein
MAVFLTFLGHGFFAIKGNESWLVYLTTVGFTIDMSKDLILAIGVLDILVAVSILIKPLRYIVLWAVIWAFATALIRPISGESIFAFIERGANWGVPLALYFVLTKNKSLKKTVHEIIY